MRGMAREYAAGNSSRTGLARVCGDLRLSGGWVGRRRCRQAGSGMARSRAKARLNFSAQGQRSGRCRLMALTITVSPGFRLRPSLSGHVRTQGGQHRPRVSPGFRLRPSLSARRDDLLCPIAARVAGVQEAPLRKSEQGDKWNRCLIEGMIVLSETGARDEQTTPP